MYKCYFFARIDVTTAAELKVQKYYNYFMKRLLLDWAIANPRVNSLFFVYQNLTCGECRVRVSVHEQEDIETLEC